MLLNVVLANKKVNNPKVIFFVDAMLGNLAKKLRLLGFDSLYSSNIEDEELLKIAREENRVIVTKDTPLFEKARKGKISSILVSGEDEIKQICKINDEFNLGKLLVSGNTSRCPVCNGELNSIEKNNVITKVPKGVLETMDNFWICVKCQKIYWEGTHIKNLQRFTADLNERISKNF